MKHLIIILISLLLLSSPVTGNNHKGETLYLWETSSGEVWKGFGHNEFHPVYKGDVKNGVPNGLGFLIYPNGTKYVGSWKNGKKNGKGTRTNSIGGEYVGDYKEGKQWNGIGYDKNGNITYKYVNGKWIKQ